MSRAAVAAGLLARLDHWLGVTAVGPEGWGSFRATWRARCDDIGRCVTLEHDGRVFTGTAVDISAEADIIVELSHGGRRSFAAANTTRVW